MRSTFDSDGLTSFLTKTLTGSVYFDPLPKQGLKIKKASKWDGKDAAPIVDNYDDL